LFFFLPDVLILVLRAIPGKHTDLSLPKCSLGITNVFTEEATGEGAASLTYVPRD
jgi:hypothetical protein